MTRRKMGIPKKKIKNSSPRKTKTGNTLSSQYKIYLKKDIEDYNSHDLVFYFADVYKKIKKIPYFIKMAEDSAKMKRLLTGLDSFTIIKLINWSIANKKNVSIGMLCSSWINSFIVEAGIQRVDFTRYEVILDSPFLTDKELDKSQDFYDKMVFASDYGDINGEVFWKNKLEKIYAEIRRRKEMLHEHVEDEA